ncbi:MAG: VWA domain-containing protein [Candidatus Acidiferrales bacterium]
MTGMLLLALAVPAELNHAQQNPPPPPPPQGEKPQPVQPGHKISVEVNLVDVLFTVLDRRNKLVTDLTKSDFRVLDDNVPQDINDFIRQTDLPLRIGLLLDTSNSIRDRLHFEQDAAIDFLYNVLRRGKDQAFLMTFDEAPYVVQDYTDDAGKLRDEVMKMRAGGTTAIYDAVYTASQDQLSNPPRPPGNQPDIVRRVMVLISDGDDVVSDHTKSEAIEMAQRASVVIYTISTNTEWISMTQTDEATKAHLKYNLTEGDKVLKELAEETGGRAFYPYHIDDLNQSFLDIGDELRSQYSLDYNPSNYHVGGPYHRIKVEVVDRKGLQVRSRKGYFVRKGAAPANKPGI